MDISEVVKRIPSGSMKPVSKGLIDILLSSRKVDVLPGSLVREILSLAKKELLASSDGVRILLQASALVEGERVLGLLEGLECGEAASALRESRIEI